MRMRNAPVAPVVTAVLVAMVALSGCFGDAEPEPWTSPEPPRKAPVAKPDDPEAYAEYDATWLQTAWGFVRRDYAPPPEGQHAILYMEGYMGAGTPADALASSGPFPDPVSPTHYVRMDDGVLIAVTIHHEFSGILTGHAVSLAFASIRGTGCSGGTFDLFDVTHREDGAHIIDWLATQPGFEPEVGLFGASYSGITALLVASEQPKQLAAVSANMVIGDMYRDIAYPGGVPNIAFPGTWTLGFRPAADMLGTWGGVSELDAFCIDNVVTREPLYPADHAAFGMYTRRTDDPMYRVRSPVEFADQIDVPILLGHSFQDEQTGPRGGPTVWAELAPPSVADPCAPGDYVPRHMLLTNGVHGTSTDNAMYYALPWFAYWLKGDAHGYDDPSTPDDEGDSFCDLFDDPVRVQWEKRGRWVEPSATGPATVPGDVALGGVTTHDGFPVPGTEYQIWHLLPEGRIAREAPSGSGSETYGHLEQRAGAWDYGDGGRNHDGSTITQPLAPDMLRFRSEPLGGHLTVLGPITLSLNISTTAPDTDVFVTVADVDPAGDVTYLQKGMLRLSHRAIDPDRSWFDAAGVLVRPSYTNVNPTMVTPLATSAVIVDVFPLGHQFRAGHQIQVQLHAPPIKDGEWGYGPIGLPAMNTISLSGAAPSSIVLPIIESPRLGEYAGCGVPDGYRCVPAADH